MFERSFQPLSIKDIEVEIKLHVLWHIDVEQNEFIFPKKKLFGF